MIYAQSPEPPTSSVEAVQERRTWPQVATFAIRAAGAEGGIRSVAPKRAGEASAVSRMARMNTSLDISLNLLRRHRGAILLRRHGTLVLFNRRPTWHVLAHGRFG